MLLKRLDIVGFKSFAERIAVDFVPGVTAVVGPNGSGKSNVTDAIRWVLGEQSAKSLRGAKMEDIIFSGSDSRRPLNFAEVSLTLENEDHFLPIEYNEVSVTRRVYRSGDSEFFINKQPCRLKDIVDLFMDSGLGKEAFSIISQGRVEEILNSKPEERRTIFEEAAGVLKYKTRKKKAEGKLFESQENLNRVNDILHELEGQVEPLKIQASIAKDYLQQKEELEQIEVALTVYEIEELHEKWQRLSVQLEKQQQDELQLTSAIQAKEAKIEQMRDHAGALDESVNDLQNILLHASEELEKLEGRKEVLKERKKNASQNKEQLAKSIEELTERIAQLQVQKDELQAAKDQLQSEANLLKKQLTEKQEQLKLFAEDNEQVIESLKSEYIEILNKQAASKNEMQMISRQLSQQDARNEKLELDNEKFIEERSLITERKLQAENGLSEVHAALEEQIHLFREAQKKAEAVKNNYEKQEKTLYQAYQYLQQGKSRQEMLEELEDDYSGFFQGVKEVLKARGNKLNGIEGAVAELISVPKQYETAIEIALGGAMQHVIVQTEQDGRSAIQYLKGNGYGRATFLPLNVMKAKFLQANQQQAVSGHDAFVGQASSLIEYNSKYAAAIESLLGNVVIATDLKGANELAKLLSYRVRIVTLDGDVVNPGGSMTGGAIKQKNSSILSRKSELEELKARITDMEGKTASLEDLVKKLKHDVQQQADQLEILKEKGEHLRSQEQRMKEDLREIEYEEKRINERLSIYDLDKAQYSEDKDNLVSRQKILQQELQQFEVQTAELDEQIRLLTERKFTDQTSKEALLAEISDLKITFAAKSEQLNSAAERLNHTVNEWTSSSDKLNLIQDDLKLLSSEMTNSSSGEIQLEEAANRKLQDKNETVSLIASRRAERLKLQTELEDLELEAKELKRTHKGLSIALKDDEVKLNRIDVELETRLAHLREEYLLSFDAAKEAYPLTIDAEEARKKVRLIRMSIDELGTVNLGAIEEYERVSERYEFLLEQKNDLQEAKDTLYQVIDEMDIEMKRRFEQTFNGIRFHFESVFQSLFGGGRADLRLTDPEDLLNTGVEIVAQPPGKKLQNLGLLSGGERALTAIGLLFSILKVRPVPFCILDEVEAALDEANVHRYAQYLKRYSGETQFIVITHRKGTMELADVLYGITMQESGVSKLVSVRLDESREMVPI
ncbi:chromosome segregation protein SMC [Cytobacillus gottheilii]|uniref:Chromosome partition protein Smc n=1 Tax=Cytobacillus gottheilii TaxID=859144 RepID=A0ABX8FGW9_9BACI|nr:chromosome segregation protein SMC [Cytobacillus gottheilii]QVY63254.1 chromosome segregation protein SMC [Cytobacillus gottheilii]